MSTPERQRDKQLIRELRARLYAWDPIGGRPPPDEYDCLHGPILRALREGAPSGELADVLHRQLVDHFGLTDVNGEGDIATQLVEWYSDSRRSN